MFHPDVIPVFILLSEAVFLVDTTQGWESENLVEYSGSTIDLFHHPR